MGTAFLMLARKFPSADILYFEQQISIDKVNHTKRKHPDQLFWKRCETASHLAAGPAESDAC